MTPARLAAALLPPLLLLAEGERGTVQPFATGLEHPIDVVVDGDGSLLLLDEGPGKLYRIVYTGS